MPGSHADDFNRALINLYKLKGKQDRNGNDQRWRKSHRLNTEARFGLISDEREQCPPGEQELHYHYHDILKQNHDPKK